jgi:methyl-accepting chemotaxis protein
MPHDTVLTVFVVLAAVAIVMQAFVMFSIWRAIEKIPTEIDEIRGYVKDKLDPLTQSMSELVGNVREPIRTITANLAEISQTARQRSVQADEVVEVFLEKSRAQIIRTDELLTSLAGKIEETGDKLQQSVMAPIQEIAALIRGVRTGWDFLFSRRRGAPANAENLHDEQLFI